MTKNVSLSSLLSEINSFIANDCKPKKVIAGHPPRPHFEPLDRPARQVLFWDNYTCRCGQVYLNPGLSNQLFKSNGAKGSLETFEPIPVPIQGLKTEISWRHHEIPYCPACLDARVYTQEEIRMCGFSAPSPQRDLDFENWLHKPSDFPLVPRATVILSTLFYPTWKGDLKDKPEFEGLDLTEGEWIEQFNIWDGR